MQPGTSAYSGIVSNRSRRLRTVAAVLLAAVLGMAAYGIAVLMPHLKHNVDTANRAAAYVRIHKGQQPAPSDPLHYSAHERRLLRFEVLFAYAYWSVGMVFVLSLLLVAWLDLREVSRNYVASRRELWQAATAAAQKSITETPPDESKTTDASESGPEK